MNHLNEISEYRPTFRHFILKMQIKKIVNYYKSVINKVRDHKKRDYEKYVVKLSTK